MIVAPFDVLQNIFFAAMVIPLGGVAIFLFFRFRSLQREYLKRFPPVEGMPLDMYFGGGPFSATRALWSAMFQTQEYPDLELMRREVWRKYRLIPIWIFGYPTIMIGLAALSIAVGFVRFR